MAIGASVIGKDLGSISLLVTRSRLRHFARATGQTDPVYTDLDAARRAGHRDLPVPPTFVFGIDLEDGPFTFLTDLGVDLRAVLHGEQGFGYHRTAHAGDELTARGRIVDVYDKKGGQLEFVVRQIDVTDAAGETVARMRNTFIVQHRTREAGAGTREKAATATTAAAVPIPPTDSELQVGTVVGPLTVDPISRTTLALFAGASGDHNPIHIDIDFAKSGGFDDVFAHGMLSMAYLARLLTDLAPQERLRSYRVRFVAITPVHGQPTCTGVVTGIDEVDGERRATLKLHVTLADGTVTLLGEAVLALS